MSEPSGQTLTHTDGRLRRAGSAATRPHLFLALQAESPLAPPSRHCLADVDCVTIGRGDVRQVARAADPDGGRRLTIRVADPWMSKTHAQLTRVLGRWVIEDAGSRNGALVNGQVEKRVVLADGDLVELGHTFFIYRDALVTAPEHHGDLTLASGATTPGLATLLPSLAQEFEKLAQVARSPVSVVVCGDTGTGKELIARAVHQLSGRAGAFVAVNCGALPEALVESELFGHKKGAFTGAAEERPGYVRASDGGTLFLDEIGDLPPQSQAAFLRVLQEREVVPVGSTRAVKVDLRLVAATHRDLELLVTDGEFRADLLARISGFTVKLPRLADRREDLGILVGALLRRSTTGAADPGAVRISAEAARLMFRYEWPSNVRELEKVLTTAVVLAGEGRVEPEHLPEAVRTGKAARPVSATTSSGATRELSEQEQRHREELIALLREHEGNISAVARVVGKARMQVQRWIKRYGLEPERYRRA